MNKRESEVPILLIGTALALLCGSYFLYDSIAARHYKESADALKDFHLPVLTSIVATLVTFIAAYCFLRRGHNNSQADQANYIAGLVFARIEEQLKEYRKSGRDDALLELAAKVIEQRQPYLDSNKNEDSSGTNKEPGTSSRSKTRSK